jgi:MFS family permease
MSNPADTARRPGLRQAFRSLESPEYRPWFFAQVFSASGTMTQGVALSWLVLRLTGSGVDLGLMTACTFGPLLFLGPYSGTLVDRFDRRRLLIVTQTLLLLLAGLTAVLIATNVITLWMLFVIAVVTGCVNAPDGTARQVYVVDLVGTQRLASAVSLYEVVLNISRVVGPGVGGALLATVGVAACCALNAASYLQPLFVLLRHRPRHAATVSADGAPAAPAAPKAPPGQLRAGLRYAWRNRPIRVSLFLAASSGLLFNMGVTLPLLATRVFHLGGGGYGLMMAVFGLGALPGAVLASAGSGRPTGRSVGVLALATAAAVLGTAAAPALWLVMVGLAVTGCLSIWFIAQANTLVQLASDPSMRGRVMGLWTMALPGTEPATSPFAGYISQTFGARDGFSLSGVALLLTAVIGWRALNDRPASAGEGAAGEAAAKAGPAETTAPTATAALAETAVLAEPPFADTAGP